MPTIEFVIKGNAVAKGRPRSTKRGVMYTPEKTRAYEDYVRAVSSQYAPKDLLKGALEMDLHFFFQRPKSLPKSVEHNIKKIDVDNIAKAIMDSLEPRKHAKKSRNPIEGAIYENDAQIVSLWVTKEYSLSPRVEVKISDDVVIADLKFKRWDV